MLSKKVVIELLSSLESTKFHRNRKEKTYTSPYGIYAHYWKDSEPIRYIENIVKVHGISLNSIFGRRKATRLFRENEVVRAKFDNYAYKFFIQNFTVPAISDAVGDRTSVSFFAFAVNSGLPEAIKAMQKAIGTKADGKFGKNSLRSLFNATSSMSDKEISQLFNTYAYKYYRSLSIWKLFGRGWTRRLRFVGWIRKELKNG